MTRKPYAPAARLLAELHAYREKGGPEPEHITLGGLGEPCLNSDQEVIIHGVKDIYPDIPLAVLTNSTLLTDPKIRRELMAADVVLPSMDALNPGEFKNIARPCSGLDVKAIADSLIKFRKEYDGILRLEVLLLKGLNDSEAALDLMRAFVDELQPDLVDVTTITRPGSFPSVAPAARETLALWRSALSAASVIAKPEPTAIGFIKGHDHIYKQSSELSETIFQSLRRRPQTKNQLVSSLDTSLDQVEAALSNLLKTGKIEPAAERLFFQVSRRRGL